MAYKHFDGMTDSTATQSQHMQIDGDSVQLPDASYVRDAAISRDGMDLTLDGPHGTVTIDNYFAADDAPALVAPDGSTLTPELVNSFARSSSQYAQNAGLSDASPVGSVDEVSGEATITRLDGSIEHVTLGTEVYQGDVIETSADGAVNIVFSDETSFAVSEDARLAIDEYVYDPSTESGAQNFSVLKGVFVFTSGLIGRDDPDDVHISTPSGSIGIRGTIIAGNVDTGEITVVEGAIVLRNFEGQEMTLASQFETGKFLPGGTIEHLGQLGAQDVSDRFDSVSKVAPTLFSSVNDAAAEQPAVQPDANGSVDQNGDSQVDGTVDNAKPADAPVENLAPVEDDKTGEVLAPKPAPVQTVTQLGLDPMGGNNTGLQSGSMLRAPAGATGLAAPTTLGLQQNMGPAPLQPADQPLNQTQTQLQDPRILQAAPVDHAPIHLASDPNIDKGQHSIAPDKFFQVGEQQSWDYHFDKEFINTDQGDHLTFHLSANTISALNAIGAQGTAWDFDNSNGHLVINAPTVAANISFDIEVLAKDAAGHVNAGGFQSYAFTVFDASTLPTLINTSNAAFVDSAGTNNTVTVGATPVSNVHVFAGNGIDNIALSQVTNSVINLGNGNNTASIAGGSTGNTLIGGFEQDTFNISDAHNKLYGMDGDDKFTLNLNNSGLMNALTTDGYTDILMDGGHSSFRHPFILNGDAVPASENGRGDTLALTNAGSLNFMNVDDHYIRGIERIDLGSGNQNVTLSYNDIIQMTDSRNMLIIRASSGDTINFNGAEFANFTKVEDQALHDGYAGDGAPDVNFDVYSNGTVTLLIEDTNGNTPAVTGLPV